MIEIDDLHKQYRSRSGAVAEVLKGISLRVPAGGITAIVGPSGAGKSTLAKCISLLEKPTRGSIRVNGQDLSLLTGEALRRERRAIGTVFQSSARCNGKPSGRMWRCRWNTWGWCRMRSNNMSVRCWRASG